MASKSHSKPAEKFNLHPGNPHRFQYDFKVLIKSSPELKPFVFVNPYQTETIDFSKPDAVKALNKALLKHFYKINYWDIPAGYLCPPIPGRANYVHYLATLLAENGKTPTGSKIKGLDIGTGANCIYPIIGHQTFGWNFVGSDIDPKAIESAQKIITRNPTLRPAIECRLQQSPSDVFKGIFREAEKYDFTMCNPPFHASLAEAMAGTQRKWRNLGISDSQKKKDLNFGGQQAELWCKGGEQAFLTKMIDESVQISGQCLWFTSLVSKKATLPSLHQSLKKANAFEVKTIEMRQGQKVSRMLAWTFLNYEAQKSWKKERWKIPAP